jgi:hypothetical protein
MIRNYFRSLGVFGHCDTFWCTSGGGEELSRLRTGFLQSREYKPLFSILDCLRPHSERRYWIECKVMEKNINDIQVDSGQMSTGVEILLKMSHNSLTIAEEHIQW